MEILAEKIENLDSLNSLHGNSQGWITKATINEEEGFKQWHYRFKELIKQDLNGKNTYISMNTFYKTYRRIACLKELRACYIDLDIYNTKFTKEQVIMNLEENYYNQSIHFQKPFPTFQDIKLSLLFLHFHIHHKFYNLYILYFYIFYNICNFYYQ